MNRENLLIYVNAWNNYKKGNTMFYTDTERNVLNTISKLRETNSELDRFIKSLTNLSEQERIDAVNNYFKKEEPEENAADKMVSIEEIKNYPNITGAMSPIERKKLNYLINNAKILHVKQLDLNTLNYVNENGNLIEVIYDEEKNEIRTNDPDLLDYTQEIITPETIDKPVEKEEPEVITFVAPPKALVKNKKQKPLKSGYVSAFLLFALTGFAGGVIATVLTLLLS